MLPPPKPDLRGLLPALAASFDPGLARLGGSLLGDEARYKGNDVIYGPTLTVMRVAQAGRTFQALGEDPLLPEDPQAATTETIAAVASPTVVARWMRRRCIFRNPILRYSPVDRQGTRSTKPPAAS